MRAYAIGDIHGQLRKLQHAHMLIEQDRVETGDDAALVIHLGDLVDRGANSRKVIELLMQGQAEGQPWIVLKGNHDRMMALYLQTPSARDHRLRTDLEWLHPRIGGLTALESYGVDTTLPADAMHRAARTAVPQEHVEYLEDLLPFYRMEGLFFCHAGVKPGVPLQEQVEDDLIWIRDEFHQSHLDHGALIIHGHTPVYSVSHYGNRVDIDTGSAFGHDLSTVVIEDGQVFLLTDEGRKAVLPNRDQPHNMGQARVTPAPAPGEALPAQPVPQPVAAKPAGQTDLGPAPQLKNRG
ncbi:metallophosphoesterase [Alisedimentitalea sp. MJ-SS2]|uniref:metallophosphoesterase n=1 Tax=Aliisedimentitalea sp. MJ-SS2 TaxID=3049795 RepID=UPI002914D48A|nr:metallophosphoesterase [Alisedimentitalea sp. MJ-SS2]MDU8926300.1 metallophosphoesterase [Alisedimentitalea sp. MJ-SS2]